MKKPKLDPTTDAPSVTFQMCMTQAQAATVKVQAVAAGISMQAWIRHAVDQHLKTILTGEV